VVAEDVHLRNTGLLVLFDFCASVMSALLYSMWNRMLSVEPAPRHHSGDLTVAGASPCKYLSCRFIERGATFFPGRITACCANPATGKTPAIATYETDLSAESFIEGRARIIESHKRGDIVPECRGCPRLEQSEWEPERFGSYAIDEVTIAHFTSCDIRCNYCYTVTKPEQAAPLSKAPRILPVFQNLIDTKLLAPHATVRFSGGEPTLSVEFEPLLRLLTEYGVRSIVYTNATKRSEAIMEALARDKVELVLGIDAASVEVYKAIKKMNYHDKVWKVVAEYCGALPPTARNKVWAKFIFCLENFHEAEHFVRRAAEAGARHVYYDFDSSRVRPARLRAGIPLPEEITDYVAVLRHECMKRDIEVDFAQSGLVWLTPERSERVERELARLSGGAFCPRETDNV
jgi:pyruvate-formate lyase-activating enzyme